MLTREPLEGTPGRQLARLTAVHSVQAVEVLQQADEHSSQASAASKRAAAAEEEAQRFEAQGKFADAASSALQADRCTCAAHDCMIYCTARNSAGATHDCII